MTAQEHLANYSVTMEVAKEFIMGNLGNLQNIFDVCKQFGVTNDMIAEIVEIDGINGNGVANFFAQNGIDSDSLGGSSKTIEVIQSAIYHKAWSIQDTDYYEIGDNLLFEVNYDTNDGNPDYYLSNYTFNGNTYSLTGLDGNQMNLTINNLSVGSNIFIVGVTENFSETTAITKVGQLELNGTWNAELFDITGLNAQGYVASSNSHYMNNGYNLKLYSGNYNLYDLNSNTIVGAGTVKNDAIYLVYEDDASLQVVIYDNKTDVANSYYLGEIA